ncbi:hypothetical protein BH10PLA2_BH10PLA2_03730 [soil metagenome]
MRTSGKLRRSGGWASLDLLGEPKPRQEGVFARRGTDASPITLWSWEPSSSTAL